MQQIKSRQGIGRPPVYTPRPQTQEQGRKGGEAGQRCTTHQEISGDQQRIVDGQAIGECDDDDPGPPPADAPMPSGPAAVRALLRGLIRILREEVERLERRIRGGHDDPGVRRSPGPTQFETG